MGQGQGVEAKKSGCSLSPLRARTKSRSGPEVIKTYLGNKYFWPSNDTRCASKVLISPKKVKGNQKTTCRPTFVNRLWLKIAL